MCALSSAQRRVNENWALGTVVVSERLGHSTVAFTMDIYSHAIPSMEAEAAEAALVRGSS